MERMYLDNAGIDAGVLEDPEQPGAVEIELLLRVPHLEHLDLILAVSGVQPAAIGLAGTRRPEFAAHSLVLFPRHLVRVDVDRHGHRQILWCEHVAAPHHPKEMTVCATVPRRPQ
jgi:hypothetical protein